MSQPANPKNMAAWARRYIEVFNLALVSIEPGEKAPKGNGWNKPGGYITDADQAEAFWAKHPKHNMGVVLGPSRVCSLDVDHVEYCRQVLRDVLDVDLDALAVAYPTLVGNPARFRVMFTLPEGVEFSRHSLSWPNPLDPDGSKHKLATVALKQAREAGDRELIAAMQGRQKEFSPVTVFELRAGPVQDVLPPSIHPDTGKPYTWRNPPADGLLELPSDLVKIWNNWDIFKRMALEACPWAANASTPPAKVKKSSPPRKEAGDHPSVIDAFNRATDVENQLKAHGYIKRGKKWLAPQSSTGLPGVTVLDEADGARVFSHHGSDPLANGHMNDAFDVFCILEHNGDTSAAIKAAARALGMEHKRAAPKPPEPTPLGDLPPAPSGEAAPAFEGCGEGGVDAGTRVFQRYALIEGTTKVFDLYKRVAIKRTAFEMLVTKPLAKAWAEREDKKCIAEDQAQRLIDQAKLAGKAKAKSEVASMSPVDRYVYIDGTQDIWDSQKRRRIPVAALRVALGDAYTLWLNSSERREVDQEHLVFDPTMSLDPSVYINTFEGLPLTPGEDFSKCRAIIEMLDFLCNGEADARHWVTCWLALPLQRVGTKMATAVLMHSTMEGSGKSLLLSDIMRPIYGAYGATVGQTQLESQWSAWQSSKLYGVFEEVVSRDQRYNQVGKIKHMITGKTMRIESKFISGWEEANYMNATFLSNEIIPWPIAQDDRRLLVVWPDWTLQGELLERVIAEKDSGGIEAFYGYLLQYELGNFDAHTRPPKTPARQRLVELSMASWQTFLSEWRLGYLGDLWRPCVSSDLYALFIEWCGRNKEHSLSHTKFSGFIATQVPKVKGVPWYDGKRRAFAAFFFPEQGIEASPPPSLDAFGLAKQVEAWRVAARAAGWKVDEWDHAKKEAA